MKQNQQVKLIQSEMIYFLKISASRLHFLAFPHCVSSNEGPGALLLVGQDINLHANDNFPEIQCNLDKYILQFGETLFAIWTNTFVNLDIYI